MKNLLIEKPNRLDREQKTIEIMIGLYCRKKHHPTGGLCQDCADMQNYAVERLSRCPFGNSKPICSKCTIHCYQPIYRDRIRKIMRFSGPRMLLHHPGFLISHYLDIFRLPTRKS